MKRRARNSLPAVGAFQRWVHNQIEVDHRVFKVKHNHLQKNMFLNSCLSATLPIKITRGEVLRRDGRRPPSMLLCSWFRTRKEGGCLEKHGLRNGFCVARVNNI
jgi:hypothetical protein